MKYLVLCLLSVGCMHDPCHQNKLRPRYIFVPTDAVYLYQGEVFKAFDSGLFIPNGHYELANTNDKAQFLLR